MVSGTKTEFKVEATGEKLQFQWQKECVDITNGDGYRDTDTPTLRILNVEKKHTGQYRCHVTNYVDKKYSTDALLTVSKFFVTVT